MKTKLLFYLIFCSTSLWSQWKFEKGYFIDNEEKRHEVLIKNVDWMENPNSFYYKTEENSEEKTANVKDVKEFQVYGYNKLIRYIGKINVTSNDLQNLSSSPEPNLQDITTFLYELSVGKKNLYSFFQNQVQNFFYSDETGKINLLVFKEYNPDGDTYLIARNNQYKSQLKEIFSDDEVALKMIDKTVYETSSLIKIFNTYNQISNENNKLIQEKIHLTIKSGINFSNVNFYSQNSPQPYDAKLNSIDPRISIELESVLPFNKKKWSVLFEATYSTINAKSKSYNNEYNVSMKLGYIEFPLGIKYTIFNNENSKIFTSIKFPVFILKKSSDKLKYTNVSNNSEASYDVEKMSSNLIFGLGYSYKNKFSLEFISSLKRSFINYTHWGNYYRYNSISIGYNIF